MDAPYPRELVDKQETILFKLEEYDTVRTINLADIHDDRNAEPSLLGYSSARWIEDTLVITTSKIDYTFLHLGALPDYVPQGNNMQMLETLKLDKEQNRLLYTLTIVDTEMLTRPMVFNKFYAWRPDEKLQPYKCDEQV